MGPSLINSQSLEYANLHPFVMIGDLNVFVTDQPTARDTWRFKYWH